MVWHTGGRTDICATNHAGPGLFAASINTITSRGGRVGEAGTTPASASLTILCHGLRKILDNVETSSRIGNGFCIRNTHLRVKPRLRRSRTRSTVQ
jgi:hypothetical protein